MTTSILADTKKALGLAPEYTPFDPEIIMHINSVLADLNQLGVGPDIGLAIVDETNLWTELLASDARMNHVKSYIFMRVKMLFDPPTLGYVLTSMEKMIEKAEWRINAAREDIKYPIVATEEDLDLSEDPFEEGLILDGGIG